MAKAKDLDSDQVLARIRVARAYNSHHQILLGDKAGEIAKEHPAKLLIVDSLTSHFRSEFFLDHRHGSCKSCCIA